MKISYFWLTLLIVIASSHAALGQFDILDFDPTSEGPWSDVAATTLTVPQVADGSITLDGSTSDSEYGGFAGVTVTPGVNAWILDFPGDREWDDEADSSFTFRLAHDSKFLYMGFDVADDVVNSDDGNDAFWKDDAIEIVTDVFNDNYDNNTDNSMDPYGGHAYINYEGRFSGWDDVADAPGAGAVRWSSEVEYVYGDGEDDDIFGFGQEVDGGWRMEVRFAKRIFESEEVGNKLVEGERMGINFILDDDDAQGPGVNGAGVRDEDLEIQYAWANRLRAAGFNADEAENYNEQELEDELYLEDGFYDLIINQAGRLSHGGAGEIIFGGLVTTSCDDTTAGDLDGNGKVEFADFLVLSGNFGKDVGSASEGDIDCNGKVEFADFLVLSGNFGKDVAGAESVPEPAGFALLGFAALVAGRIRRRR